MKKWSFSVPDKETAAQLSDQYEIPPFLSLLLVTRGLRTPEQIAQFRAAADWYDPMQLPDMALAVDRIRCALDAFEPILVYGDYDADGVTATTILYSYLEACGANVRFAIPSRADGYGMSCAAVDRAAADGIKLIITVDNGVSAAEEIAYATTLGIDTVVTDHHQPPQTLPAAVAVVDPHRMDAEVPFRELCGAGVAFKLIAALEDTGAARPEELLEHFADLVAIGTVGDIVPLTGENRMFVREGLRRMADPERLGLRLLLESASLTGRGTLSAGLLSFVLVPRINAMGRMSTSERVVQLFLTDDEEEARTLTAELEQANVERQQQESDIAEAAEHFLREDPHRLLNEVLIIWGPDWHPGVIGIVASRITEKFGKPTMIVSVHDGIATGSCRSISGFSVIDALTSCAPLLTRFGGHTLAAGFSLPADRLDAFVAAIHSYAAAQGEMPVPTLHIDCKLNPAGLSTKIVDELREMEPFGAGNATPVFALCGVKLDEVQPVGGGKHLRLTVSRGGHSVQVMRFRTTTEQFAYKPGDLLDLAVTLDKSAYRGTDELSVIVRDDRPEGFDAEPLLRQKQQYEAFARGELRGEALRKMMPGRDQIAAVYRLFKAEEDLPRSMDYFCYRLQAQQIGYDRLTVALIALRQLGLIRLMRVGDTLRVRVNSVQSKVLLDSAPILAKLKEMSSNG